MGRLIDADVLIENLREIKTLYGVPMTNRDEQMIHWIIGHIKEQPTAYDVEKVVAEYEKQVEEVRHTVYSDNYLQNMSIQTIVINALFDLSEKIRKGGVE